MKRRLTVLAVAGLLSLGLYQDSALSQDSELEIMDIVNILRNSDNCRETEEVWYRSEKLVSPAGNISAHIDGVVRRLGTPNAVAFEPGVCMQDEQTPVANLAIESAGQARTINLGTETDAIAFLRPTSFSPDGRFLTIVGDYVYGFDGSQEVLIVDLRNDRIFKNQGRDAIPYCRDGNYSAYFVDPIGFTSSANLLVNCALFGCVPSPSSQECEWSELVDLGTGRVRRVAADSVAVENYGSIISPAAVVKNQVFPSR